jgi:hypothetical protein
MSGQADESSLGHGRADLNFDTIADELYGLVPGNFTSTRDARAADARRSGDRELAAAIKALKRPTTSAWLVNLLVRGRPEQVVELLDLGSAMRDAQEQLAGDELRRLSQRRRQVISGLTKAARALARDVEQTISEEAERELETSLEVALADPVAGETARSGRLTAALRLSGLGSLDLAGAVASPPDTGAVRPGSRRTRGGRADEDLGAQRQNRQRAELALLEAEAAAIAAQETVAELARRVSAAREELRRVREAVGDLQAQLVHLQTEDAAAAAEVRQAERTGEAADRSARAAERRADHARRELDRLRS